MPGVRNSAVFSRLKTETKNQERRFIESLRSFLFYLKIGLRWLRKIADGDFERARSALFAEVPSAAEPPSHLHLRLKLKAMCYAHRPEFYFTVTVTTSE